jgi:hypothetical protein
MSNGTGSDDRRTARSPAWIGAGAIVAAALIGGFFTLRVNGLVGAHSDATPSPSILPSWSPTGGPQWPTTAPTRPPLFTIGPSVSPPSSTTKPLAVPTSLPPVQVTGTILAPADGSNVDAAIPASGQVFGPVDNTRLWVASLIGGPSGNPIYEQGKDYVFVFPVEVRGNTWTGWVFAGKVSEPTYSGLIFAIYLVYVSPGLVAQLNQSVGQGIPLSVVTGNVHVLDAHVVIRN